MYPIYTRIDSYPYMLPAYIQYMSGICYMWVYTYIYIYSPYAYIS